MTIPPNAKTVTFSEDVADGYDFEAGKAYKLHRMGEKVMIYNPDEIILNNGEVTEDVMKLATFQ